jgi:hypothetical protein
VNKDVRKLVQSVSQIDGVEVRQGSNHLTVWKDGAFVTTISGTPSDHRWRDNALAELRRAGITPSVRPNGVTRTVALIPQDEIRARLRVLPKLSEFARFVVEVQETSGAPGYRNAGSAESALGQFRKGEGHLSEKGHAILDAALRQWDKVQAAKQRADAVVAIATQLDMPPEKLVPESLPGGRVALGPSAVEPPALTVRLDVEKLTEVLSRFGISLTVE